MRQTTKLKLFALCSTSLIISGVAIAPIVSCNKEPESTDVTITFYATNGGMIIGHGEQERINLVINKGTTWGDIQDKPRAWRSDEELFDHWSLTEDGPIIEDSYVLKNADLLWAVYVPHEHEFDDYTIEEIGQADGSTIRRIKGHCPTCDKYFELSDKQLEDLSGRFLIKENESYVLSDLGVTLSQYVNSSTKSELDIYLIGKPFYPDFSVSHNLTLRLHGVHNYEEDLISCLDSFNDESSGSEKIHSAIGVTIKADNIILYGKNDNDTWMGGIQASALICEHCKLMGEMATYSSINEFRYCEFDSSKIIGPADYAVYCYNDTALFDHCSFISNGKTIKIYQHGLRTNTCYEIYDCFFKLDDDEGGHDAIEIDPSHQTTTEKYVIYIDGCLLDPSYEQASLGLYHIEEGQEDKAQVILGRKPI